MSPAPASHAVRAALLAATLLLVPRPGARAADADALWASRVRPLLDAQCLKCHGPMERKGGLELDTPAAILKGGDDGPVVVPGKPEESALYRNLAPGADPHMPPKKQLGDAERAVVRDWIAALKAAPAKASRPRTERRFGDVAEAVDTLVAEGWKERGVKPAKAVDDRTWCRRVHLDLAGRIPTADEVDAFLRAPARTRRGALVDRLLASPEFAAHQRELWDVFLMGRPRRDAHEDRRRQNGWWKFLEDGFASNRPWDDMVRAMLVARPSTPADRGAAWFLYERRNEHQAIAEAVAPLVYGTRIDCAQCHDHPLSRDIRQAHYWGLVAAFNRSRNVEGETAVSESAVGGFVNFTNLRKESQPALVALLDGRTLDEARPAPDAKEQDRDDLYVDAKAKARVPRYSRRAAFAEAATHGNPLLARAFVNRTWAVLTGRGIVHPVDEMNARNAPSHPELLDWLAADFASHHHDVRRLVRGIVLARVYGLGPARGVPPEAFAGAPERPLTAEQLARSWRVAAGLPPEDDALRRATVAAMPDVLPRDYSATFQQAQFLCNSPALLALLRPEAGGAVARIAAMPDADARIRAAFLAVYGRPPDAAELREARTVAGAGRRDVAAAVSDLMWSLVTGPEFLTSP